MMRMIMMMMMMMMMILAMSIWDGGGVIIVFAFLHLSMLKRRVVIIMIVLDPSCIDIFHTTENFVQNTTRAPLTMVKMIDLCHASMKLTSTLSSIVGYLQKHFRYVYLI